MNGIEGSLSAQRDWFWFVNGYEGDRSAASYRLHDGDVAWLDYRGWQREGEARVVVGAFPEPFLHGYGGKTRPVAVRYDRGSEKRARKLGAELGAAKVAPLGTPVPAGANVLEVRGGASSLTARAARRDRRRPGALRLARRSDPDAAVHGSVSPGPAALLLGAAGTAALLTDRLWAVAMLTVVLLGVCLRAPVGPARRLSLRRAHDWSRRLRALAVSSGRARTGRSSGRGRRSRCSGRST